MQYPEFAKNILSVACYYATDVNIRHQATSGGLGSALVRYLFSSGRVGSALSFEWDSTNGNYVPKIIYNEEDYVPVGSIYHEINIISFLKENVTRISSPFVCFTLPCQSLAIRQMLDKAGITSYIIQLTCSSQQSLAATDYLLKRMGIVKEDIALLKYRGEGWPSGINIFHKDGNRSFVPNVNSLWMDIFHSRIYIQKRCHHCNPNRLITSDLVLADPWRIDDTENEKAGRTLCAVCSEDMQRILKEMEDSNLLVCQLYDVETYMFSQEGTLRFKQYLCKHRKIARFYEKLLTSTFYRRMLEKHITYFNLHCRLNNYFKRFILKLSH